MLLWHCNLGSCGWKSSCCLILVFARNAWGLRKPLYCLRLTYLLPSTSVINDLGYRWPRKVWPNQNGSYSERVCVGNPVPASRERWLCQGWYKVPQETWAHGSWELKAMVGIIKTQKDRSVRFYTIYSHLLFQSQSLKFSCLQTYLSNFRQYVQMILIVYVYFWLSIDISPIYKYFSHIEI